MPQPASTPEWGGDTNFSSGPQDGKPVKVDPGAGARAQGLVPGDNFVGEGLNWLLYWICQWILYLKDLDTQTSGFLDKAFSWTGSHSWILGVGKTFKIGRSVAGDVLSVGNTGDLFVAPDIDQQGEFLNAVVAPGFSYPAVQTYYYNVAAFEGEGGDGWGLLAPGGVYYGAIGKLVSTNARRLYRLNVPHNGRVVGLRGFFTAAGAGTVEAGVGLAFVDMDKGASGGFNPTQTTIDFVGSTAAGSHVFEIDCSSATTESASTGYWMAWVDDGDSGDVVSFYGFEVAVEDTGPTYHMGDPA